MTGTLYIIPTPIGNLEDMTFRAVSILKKVSLIGAEDTRNSGYLLKHYGIETAMISYHKFNERSRVAEMIDRLQKGDDIAIISDAGTPGISDPASIIIKSAIENNIRVEALPGATALIPAVVVSGFNQKHFHFIGFLPEKESDKIKVINEIKSLKSLLIFYVSPHKIDDFLSFCLTHLGNRQISISREISKLHETTYRGPLETFVNKEIIVKPKGEFVVVIDGKEDKKISDQMILDIFATRGTGKDVIKDICAEFNLKKNRVYKISLAYKKQNN